MAISARKAAWPFRGDTPVHIPRPPFVPAGFLLPGDPARVDMAASVLTDFVLVGQNREFRMGIGYFDGVPIGLCSTGVGGASTEITVVELAAIGVTHVIRTGGMGALSDDLDLGDFVAVSATLANSACARPYAPGEADVLADADLCAALDAARAGLALPGRRGKVVTADGYYRAQGRPDHPGGDGHPDLLDSYAARGADGFEMEAEIVLAVGRALGLKAAAILAVHAHRRTDGWLEDFEITQRNLVRIGAEALRRTLQPAQLPPATSNPKEA